MTKGRKSGINFLNDLGVAEEIVKVVDPRDKDVLEIGPGHGGLTRFIEGYRSLTLIEREKNFENYLKTNFPGARTIIGDALKIEWPRFQVFISNMPYSISTPLLEKLWSREFEVAVVTLQKEVADRILASPGTKDFSRLTVMMQLKFEVQKKLDIPPYKFTPTPRVYSTVLKLTKKKSKIPENFDGFLKLLFSQRRKKIKNIIASDVFQDKRPEELTTQNLLKLYENFNEKQ